MCTFRRINTKYLDNFALVCKQRYFAFRFNVNCWIVVMQFVADRQSELIQKASDGYIPTNVGIVLSYKSFGQKSHDHCCENNGETHCCKQLCLEYTLCLEEHTRMRESVKYKDNQNN